MATGISADTSESTCEIWLMHLLTQLFHRQGGTVTNELPHLLAAEQFIQSKITFVFLDSVENFRIDGSSTDNLPNSKYLHGDDNFAPVIMNRPIDKFTADRVPIHISLRASEAVDAERFPFILVVHSAAAHVFTQDGWIPATDTQIESVGIKTLLAMGLINGTAGVPSIPKESPRLHGYMQSLILWGDDIQY